MTYYKKGGSTIKLLIKTLLYTLLLIILTISGIATAIFYSQNTRQWLVLKTSDIISAKTEYNFKIDGISSKNLGDWKIDNLEIYKNSTPILKGTQIVLKWNPSILLDKKVEVNELGATELEIYIEDKVANPAAKTDNKSFALHKSYPVTVDKFAVTKLVIHSKILKSNNEYTLHGKLNLMGDNAPFFVDMDIRTLDTNALSASIKTKIIDKNNAVISANINEETGGFLGRKLHLQDDNPLVIKMQTDVKKDKNSYALTINEFNVPYLNSLISANGKLDINIVSQSINLDSLVINIDDRQQKISGSINNQDISLNTSFNNFPISLLQPWIKQPEIKGEVSGAFSINGSLKNPDINSDMKFTGKYANIPLKSNVSVSGNINKITISDLTVQTNKNEQEYIKLTGHYINPQLDMKLKISAMPTKVISAMGFDLKPGKITADLDIKGTKQSPSLNGNVKFISSISDKKHNIPVTFSADVATQQNILNAKLSVIKKGKTIGKASIVTPVQTYLDFNKLKSGIPLDARLSTDFDLAYIQLLLDPEIHDIKGVVKIDVKLSGNWQKPILNGDIELNNGYYENKQSGTVLHNTNIKLAAKNTKITLIAANASDGEEGTIGLSGFIDWSDSFSPLPFKKPIQFELKANNAKLLRRTDIEGITSGNLKLEGTFRELLLSGSLDITPFTLTLDNLVTSNIPELKITEENNNKGVDYKESTSNKFPVINMNIVILAKNQAYLRGRGVKAELQGKIDIEGTLNKPKYSGYFKTVRGNYEVLGKKFILQDGSVRFEGDSVSLLIPAVYTGDDIQVTAQISGTLEKLDLTLSSVPSMPQDEIVSHLLFGKSAKNISPFQAIRLANEIRSLKTGGKGLFNPLEKTRKIIGVDDISVESQKTDTGQDVNVSVGKYISEKVYLKVGKGSNPAQPMQGSVEVEVLPNLNVESTTGGDSGVGGIQLHWKHDY